MSFRCLLACVVILTSVVTCQVRAENIIIGSPEWEGYTQPDGQGIYFTLLKKVFSDDQLNFELDTYNRSLAAFEKGKIDVVLGVFREDVKQAILPNWHLNTDYPIVAFYDPKKHDLRHAEQLEKLSLGWLRGYQFERFFSKSISGYEVDNFAQGFRMLKAERLDAFVDYAYNLPPQYNGLFDTIEVLPKRHLYVAFQKNKRGEKLANIFDQRMSQLRASGELEQLFGLEYQHADFAGFDPSKEKLILYTDEINLLRAHLDDDIAPEDTLNYLLGLIFDQLDQYKIEFRLIKDYSNLQRFEQETNACFSDMIKNDERQQNYIFSQPFSLYLGQRLFSRVSLSDEEEVSLPKLMAKNQHLTLGILKGRRYGGELDNHLDAIPGKQKFLVAVDNEQLFKMFSEKRFNLLIEYQSEMAFYWPQINSEKLFSYKIQGARDFNLGHMMCNKTQIGQQFVDDFNRAILKVYDSVSFLNAQLSSVDSNQHDEFIKYFNQVFLKR